MDPKEEDARTAKCPPLTKLRANLAEARDRPPPNGHEHRFVCLLSTGSFAPVHKMHFQIFEAAKQWLEDHHGFTVVGGWISPSHDDYVSRKMARMRAYSISAHHRLEMCQLVASRSSWIDVSAWEAQAPGFINFPSVARYHAEYLAKHIPEKVTLMYLGGADLIDNCGLLFGISAGSTAIPVVAVGRPGHTELLKQKVERIKQSSAKHGLACDTQHLYIVSKETHDFSSTQVRKLLEKGEPVAEQCGEEVEAYLRQNKLHEAFRPPRKFGA